MPTENRKILIRRGTGNPPSDVVQGELLLRTDTDGIATNKVFIGTGTGTAKAIANLTDMGVTATSTQLNYVSDVTSNVQSQLNTLNSGKASLTGAAFTGAVTVQAPSAGSNPATKTYVDTAISNLVNNADSALDTLGELASALDDDANFASTVTTSLASKASENNATLTGTPTAPTATAGTNTTQLATTAFVTGAINSVSGFTPANVEWNFVQKITGSGDTLSITNSSLTNENFDIANYDYKFVVDLDTTAEDNDFPKIRLNNITGSEYNSLYENITLDAVGTADNGTQLSFGGYDRTSVETGLQLITENQDVSLTALSLEFVVSQSLASYTYNNVTKYALMIQGTGNALAIEAPTGTPKIWPVTSRFNGSLSSSAGLTQVDIIHFISAGTTDNSVVRIYKRAK